MVAVPRVSPAVSMTVAVPSLSVVSTGGFKVPKDVVSETSSFGTGLPYSSIIVTVMVDCEALPVPAVIVDGLAVIVIEGVPLIRTASKGMT